MPRDFICDICGSAYPTLNLLQRHLVRHGERTFQCGWCDQKYACKYEKTAHEKRMHSDSKRYKCTAPGCDAKFFVPVLLKRHFDSVHLGIRYNCEVPGCERSLSSRASYMTHLKDVHKTLNKAELEKYLENYHENPRVMTKGETQPRQRAPRKTTVKKKQVRKRKPKKPKENQAEVLSFEAVQNDFEFN